MWRDTCSRTFIPYANLKNEQEKTSLPDQLPLAAIRLRQMLSTHKDLKKKIEDMEKKYDQQFQIVFEAIKQLLETDVKPRKQIGFIIKEKQRSYGRLKSKPPGRNN